MTINQLERENLALECVLRGEKWYSRHLRAWLIDLSLPDKFIRVYAYEFSVSIAVKLFNPFFNTWGMADHYSASDKTERVILNAVASWQV